MSDEVKHTLDIHTHAVGNERRAEMFSDIMKNSTFLPSTVEYKDIDEDFNRWVSELTITSSDGKEFPTFALFSNQRFSEYTQSWEHTDKDNNLLLNFKTVSRENNPQYGKIQNGFWNIPGEERFYTMKKQVVLDDNGSESFLILKMHQPTAIDLNYKVSVFTTQYTSINEFNTLINKAFRARQAYIRPNGHFMPMTLESISDESSYQIDDRQFYAQTFSIKVMAYIITEDDYRVEECPIKRGVSIGDVKLGTNMPDAEIIEYEGCNKVNISLYFPEKCNKNIVHFTCDSDISVDEVSVKNLYNNYKIYINGVKIDEIVSTTIKNGDEFKLMVSKKNKKDEAEFIISGLKTQK